MKLLENLCFLHFKQKCFFYYKKKIKYGPALSVLGVSGSYTTEFVRCESFFFGMNSYLKWELTISALMKLSTFSKFVSSSSLALIKLTLSDFHIEIKWFLYKY